jgi:anti-sigma factor RsiW
MVFTPRCDAAMSDQDRRRKRQRVFYASLPAEWDPRPVPLKVVRGLIADRKTALAAVPSHKLLAPGRSLLPSSALAISAMATSFFASALAIARMA